MRTIFDLKGGFQVGMHGCGCYAGTVHSNTYDGFKYWLNKGIKVMEIDISNTSDGKYVALAHKMSPMYLRRLEICDYSEKNAFSHDWFMGMKLFPYSTKGLRPLDVEMILVEMLHDENLLIMFDLWGMWSFQEAKAFSSYLLSRTNDNNHLKNRMMIEAYNQNMILGIKEGAKGSIPIIYCVRDDSAGQNHTFMDVETLKSLGIKCVSYPWKYKDECPGEFEDFVSNEFVVVSVTKDASLKKKMQVGGGKCYVDRCLQEKERVYKNPCILFWPYEKFGCAKNVEQYKIASL